MNIKLQNCHFFLENNYLVLSFMIKIHLHKKEKSFTYFYIFIGIQVKSKLLKTTLRGYSTLQDKQYYTGY